MNHTNGIANEERKYVRLQQVGLSLLLLIPISIIVIGIKFGFVLGGENARWVTRLLTFLILGLALTGASCFIYGGQSRIELERKGNEEENDGDSNTD